MIISNNELQGVVGQGGIEPPLSDFQSDVHTSYTTDPYRKNFIVHEILYVQNGEHPPASNG